MESDEYFDASTRVQAQLARASNAVSDQTVYFQAIVPDFTITRSETIGQFGASLRDQVEGQTWFLKRLVGKLHLAANLPAGLIRNRTQAWQALKVAAGFFVARAQDQDPSLPDVTFQEMDPWQMDNSGNPWIWRRTWMLSTANVNDANIFFPNSTDNFGSIADGPHIDAKTARSIAPEERLWLAIGVQGYDPELLEVSGVGESQINGILDIRVLGTMTRKRNKGTF